MQEGTMLLADELRRRIRESLKELHPEKVVVFGSYVQGAAGRDSDIDLIVVLNSDVVPKTYQERMMNRLLVRRALDELNRDYALDVRVYTTPEWKRFQDSGSAFSKEVAGQGVEV
jgi:predicted nucleotidyltransferase